jgi:CMP-N-acetylneuraminic acid synthetase
MAALCVIPARANSSRLPLKNWQDLHGKSLTMHAYDAAIASGVCDRVVISSDSRAWPIHDIIDRPAHLSLGEPDSLSRTVQHALQECEKSGTRYDLIVTLQPATPLRSPVLIREMVQNVVKTRAKGAITMAKTVPWTWQISVNGAQNGWFPGPYPRSQDVQIHAFQEINTVQIGDRESVLAGKRWGLPLLVTELPSWATVDIDTQEDLEEVRDLWPVLSARLGAMRDFPWHLVRIINGQGEV